MVRGARGNGRGWYFVSNVHRRQLWGHWNRDLKWENDPFPLHPYCGKFTSEIKVSVRFAIDETVIMLQFKIGIINI